MYKSVFFRLCFVFFNLAKLNIRESFTFLYKKFTVFFHSSSKTTQPHLCVSQFVKPSNKKLLVSTPSSFPFIWKSGRGEDGKCSPCPPPLPNTPLYTSLAVLNFSLDSYSRKFCNNSSVCEAVLCTYEQHSMHSRTRPDKCAVWYYQVEVQFSIYISKRTYTYNYYNYMQPKIIQ